MGETVSYQILTSKHRKPFDGQSEESPDEPVLDAEDFSHCNDLIF